MNQPIAFPLTQPTMNKKQPSVVLHWGHCRLLMPSEDVLSLEASLDINTDGAVQTDTLESTVPTRVSVGHFLWRESFVPVFALSDDFMPLQHIPKDRRVCALLQAPLADHNTEKHPVLGLLCDHVDMIGHTDWEPLDIPPSMQTAAMAFEQLALHHEQLLYRSHTQRLRVYIGSLTGANTV